MNKLDHEFYMRKALLQAKIAFKKGEVPVGAVLVNSKGEILSRGYNKIEKEKCQLAHAEAIAIKKACKKIKDWRLDNCLMYVTLEPCLMCLGLMKLSRIKGVIFGSTSTLFGLGINFDKLPIFYKKGFEVKGGVLKEESLGMLKQFFKLAREGR
ncbi:MAG: nucleoside deaminase [bacterium]